MKKAFLGFSCFFLLFSCSVSDSSGCGCYVPVYYEVSLNTTVVDANGNSFKITEVRLENETLCFKGDYVFQNLDSNAFYVYGLNHIASSSEWFEYPFSLEATNQKNEQILTDTNLTLSGEWVLCFPVDQEIVSDIFDSSEEAGGEKLLHAYFMINDERGHTDFYIHYSQIILA